MLWNISKISYFCIEQIKVKYTFTNIYVGHETFVDSLTAFQYLLHLLWFKNSFKKSFWCEFTYPACLLVAQKLLNVSLINVVLYRAMWGAYKMFRETPESVILRLRLPARMWYTHCDSIITSCIVSRQCCCGV